MFSLRSVAEGYYLHLAGYTEHLTADITDSLSVFLYEVLKKTQALATKQRDDIKLTLTTNREAVDVFIRSIDSRLSRPEPFL